MTDYPLSALAASLAPDPDLPVDVWADTYQVIPKDSGANEYGKFRTSRTPHARMVMQALSDHHPCKRVVLMGASQMLKTQTGLNWLMASIHQSPANFLWILPTGKLAKRASTRIAKNIAAVPEVAERVATPRSRDSVNTLDTKEYIGGALFIVTAGAAANLSEVPARRVLFDEVDRAELNVNGEGDPVALAEARQTTFERNRKSYFPSSPTIRDESIVERLYLRGTQRQALAECLHCGELQPLEFERLIATEDGQGALYPCMHCGGIHTESDKPRMFARGAWSDGVGGDGETESFQISGMFLPYGWLPWVALLREYKKAKDKLDEGSEEAMIAFYNTRLARSWERQKEKTKADELMARAEPYKLGTAPAGVMRLTAAVDTQADRLELLVVGWGRWLEAWVIDYQIVRGDPSDPQTWARLDALLQTRYPHAFGQTLPIAAAFVDSGGNAMLDLQKVLSETDGPIEQYGDAARDMAMQFGVSSTEVLQSVSNFKQAGFTAAEALTLTRNALDLKIAGDVEAARASELLVASLKGFNLEASEGTRIVDLLNEVSNRYATDVNELGEGFARLSPVAKAAGLSLEETAGILTPGIEVFRSGAEVANAMRTVLLRLQDDSKPVRTALAELGVTQFNVNGELRSSRDIYFDVAKAWGPLTDAQKTYYASQLAGLDQSAKFIAVMDGVNKTLEISGKGFQYLGSAAKEVEIRLASTEIQVKRMSARVAELLHREISQGGVLQ